VIQKSFVSWLEGFIRALNTIVSFYSVYIKIPVTFLPEASNQIDYVDFSLLLFTVKPKGILQNFEIDVFGFKIISG